MLRAWLLEHKYNSLLDLRYTSHTKTVAFADDLVIMIKEDSITEAENIANVELSKISAWAIKIMLLTRRK